MDLVGTIARDRRRASQAVSQFAHIDRVGAGARLRRFTASAFPWDATSGRMAIS
jgi:hypothetical protein